MKIPPNGLGVSASKNSALRASIVRKRSQQARKWEANPTAWIRERSAGRAAVQLPGGGFTDGPRCMPAVRRGCRPKGRCLTIPMTPPFEKNAPKRSKGPPNASWLSGWGPAAASSRLVTRMTRRTWRDFSSNVRQSVSETAENSDAQGRLETSKSETRQSDKEGWVAGHGQAVPELMAQPVGDPCQLLLLALEINIFAPAS